MLLRETVGLLRRGIWDIPSLDLCPLLVSMHGVSKACRRLMDWSLPLRRSSARGSDGKVTARAALAMSIERSA